MENNEDTSIIVGPATPRRIKKPYVPTERNEWISERIMDRKKNVIGLFYGVRVGGVYYGIGFSMCTKTSKDKLNKKKMVEIAKGRAMHTKYIAKQVPQSIKKQYIVFDERCKEYFQKRWSWQNNEFAT